jgi:hypothetical protein
VNDGFYVLDMSSLNIAEKSHVVLIGVRSLRVILDYLFNLFGLPETSVKLLKRAQIRGLGNQVLRQKAPYNFDVDK